MTGSSEDIERSLEELLPTEWDDTALNALFGAARFERDAVALNEAMRAPARGFILRGGKRLRPKLFLLLVDALGGAAEQWIDVARLIEVAHNATLVVDDVEDDSDIRRNKPTLHKAFGIDVGINTGIAMHFFPLRVLQPQLGALTAEQQVAFYSTYIEELTQLYAGQTIDIWWHREQPPTITPDQYFEMCRLKTGSLMRLAARLACVITGQTAATEQTLQTFAEAAGIAFQIRDDVLDLTGDRQQIKKAVGGDITEGKMSLPLVLALPKLPDTQQQRLFTILAQHTKDQTLIDEARGLIIDTGAPEAALQQAERLVHEATAALTKTPLSDDGREQLEAMTASFITRNR